MLKADIPNLLGTHGYNEFSVATPEPILLKFAKTIYESPLILLLCASATISAIIGNIDDAVSITIAVLIVLTVGFVQEQRSEKSLEALNKLVPHHCHVIRERETLHVLANELVPGDIVTFSTGDRIPADLRMVSCVDVEIDESSLTGETVARQKSTEACVGPTPAALADRTCIAYMGTLVKERSWDGRGDCHGDRYRVWHDLYHDARCRGKAVAAAVEHGRARTEAFGYFFWRDWPYMFDWCASEEVMAGNVHHWRYVSTLSMLAVVLNSFLQFLLPSLLFPKVFP